MYLYIEDIKNDKVGFFGAMTIEKIAKMCDAWWGDAFQEEKIHKFDAKVIHDVNLDEIPKILRDAMKN